MTISFCQKNYTVSMSAPHIRHGILPELSATLYRHWPPPSPLVVATAALKAWVTSLNRRGVGSFFMAAFQSSIILSVTLIVSVVFWDFAVAFWPSSSPSSLSLKLASYSTCKTCQCEDLFPKRELINSHARSWSTSNADGNLWYFFSSSSSELSVSSKFRSVWSFCCRNLKNSGSLSCNLDSCSLCAEALPFFFTLLLRLKKKKNTYYHISDNTEKVNDRQQRTHILDAEDFTSFFLVFLLSPFCFGVSSSESPSLAESSSPDSRNSSTVRSSNFLTKKTAV